MENRRRAGVLLAISSVPSKYGIGVFGKDCIDFAAKIKDMGFSLWQVLPFTPLDYANSPYGSDSAFAGNELFISPYMMAENGYITEDEARDAEYHGSPYTADYKFAKESHERLFKIAFGRLSETEKSGIDRFIEDKKLVNHCLYRALKAENGGKPFYEWARGGKFSEAAALKEELKEEIRYHGFIQYLFFSQWQTTKQAINALGVEIIGDMPFYVARDSVDLWENPLLFAVDPDSYSPEKVAGVPPDYFSADGQLWGNPLYDWKYHEKTGYEWWTNRIKRSFELYDILRIDHFRAFASYYAIDGKAKTAKDGQWLDGPKMKLFDAVRKNLGELPIIAEDLGVFGDDVIKLLDDSGFPGMRIIQFGFVAGEDSTHLPHNYPKNCVAYIGTHDNNTLLGWLWESNPQDKQFALDYCGYTGNDWGRGGYDAPACRKIIETVWRSSADTAIIPFQDLCGFGSDARMNVPGDDKGKWLFRTTAETVNAADAAYYRKLNETFRRY